MEIGFTNPQYLWFLLGVPILVILHLISLRYLHRRALIFANFRAISRILGSSQSVSMNTLPVFLRCLVLISLTLAISGMYIQIQVMRTDVDLMIAVDTSSSMLAQDYSPTRLSVAKQSVLEFLDGLGNVEVRAGIVAFGGVPYLVVPPTTDRDLLKQGVLSLNVSQSGGTAIGDAIIMCVNNLLTSNRAKEIILITDGRNNIGTSPLYAVELAAKHGIVINTVGVGTNSGAHLGNLTIITRLDSETLRTLSLMTNGKFFVVTSPDEMKDAFKDLSKASSTKVPVDLSPYLLLAGLSVIIVEWIFVNTKYRTLP